MILCEANVDGKDQRCFDVLRKIVSFIPLEVFLGLCKAIERIEQKQIPDADEWHNKIKYWYSWYWVAQHTENVYDHVMKSKRINLRERFQRCVWKLVRSIRASPLPFLVQVPTMRLGQRTCDERCGVHRLCDLSLSWLDATETFNWSSDWLYLRGFRRETLNRLLLDRPCRGRAISNVSPMN